MGGHSVFDFFIVSGTVRDCMSITNMLKSTVSVRFNLP